MAAIDFKNYYLLLAEFYTSNNFFYSLIHLWRLKFFQMVFLKLDNKTTCKYDDLAGQAMGTDQTTVTLDLGFLEKAPSWNLSSRFFPSKVGGKPAWLALDQIPDATARQCEGCARPMQFLAQIYAPLEHESPGDPSTFHRTLFVFLCRSSECHSPSRPWSPFRVFRCQLGRENAYYPTDPPVEKEDWRPDLRAEKYTSICRLCGCPGDKQCSGCRQVFYCSKEHQKLDWKAGGHKADCCQPGFDPNLEPDAKKNPLNLEEFELITEEAEEEDHVPESEEEDERETDPAELEKYVQMAREGKTGSLTVQDVQGEEFTGAAGNEASALTDETMSKFKEVISHSPQQVLRYSRRGQPLWISGENRVQEIPNCDNCGGKRVFEFQIMPQLLLSLNNLDPQWRRQRRRRHRLGNLGRVHL